MSQQDNPQASPENPEQQYVQPLPMTWESDLGLFSRLWRTTFQVLRYPVRSFASQPLKPDWLTPLSYVVTMSLLMVFIDLMVKLTTTGIPQNTNGLILSTAIIPVLSVLIPIVLSVVTHFSLKLTGKGNFSYFSTFRVCSYSRATTILHMLAGVESIVIAILWGMVIIGCGLRGTHGISPLRAGITALTSMALMLLILTIIGHMGMQLGLFAAAG